MTAAGVEAQVSSTVQSVLGREVAREASLMEAGLDSLGAVELRNSLAKTFELELPATLTFDYPSVAAIAGFISESSGAAGGLWRAEGCTAVWGLHCCVGAALLCGGCTAVWGLHCCVRWCAGLEVVCRRSAL
jgi:acyl carrier protein